MREGSIIPVQNSNTKQPAFPLLTTKDTQINPIEIHILPNCTHSNAVCHAQGVYFNDDGETLNTTAYNRYQWQYTQDKGVNASTLEFSIPNKQIADKNSNKDGSINANDHWYSIQIYNAKAYGFDVDYSVTATKDDGTVLTLSDATYIAQTDRLVIDKLHSSEPEISLAELSKVVFTRKA